MTLRDVEEVVRVATLTAAALAANELNPVTRAHYRGQVAGAETVLAMLKAFPPAPRKSKRSGRGR